jgi:hypothetical protein
LDKANDDGGEIDDNAHWHSINDNVGPDPRPFKPDQ